MPTDGELVNGSGWEGGRGDPVSDYLLHL